MLLAIDVGNSHTVIGLFDGTRLRSQWRLGTSQAVTVDELAARLHTLFTMEKITFGHISDMVIASVVPPVTSTWNRFAQRFLGQDLKVAPMVVSHELDCLIRVELPNPAEVGADRLVNAAAAYQQHQGALIIIDFGTAITLDCVSADGAYLGGTITPGIAIALEAMGQRTAKLPRVDIATPPAAAIGNSTVEAIRSGVLFGYAGLVDGLIRRIRAQMAPADPKVIATGGMAALIAPYSEGIEEVDPLLTLEGLRLIHARNH
ncbi:type III pantothenate kinase [Desulfurivibrio alkaliphilus]|uniref:Type III pantothenate kinase n=1 Tax=Desulfurivibrio alkaliphilus (strain DSM 19089 / UNIQEM U267 / AHT2) TaxID=589865 RepID=D6Z6Q5_DESAT|nr:type III pantothenate kinase [Desulfurivibrio alkaliphilus]ADH85014.1 transcriptional activator, Baf family [Desulfurivibrio alkaliphilus AHT 2]